MLDISLIRNNPQEVTKKLQGKIPSIDLSPLLTLDQKLRENITALEQRKHEQNAASKQIGEKKRQHQPVEKEMEEMKALRAEISSLQERVNVLKKDFENILFSLPNLPDDCVPFALDPKQNVCVKRVGEKPTLSFPIKNHIELGEINGLFDFKASAKITGSNWPMYRGLGARLERALLQYMLDTHYKNGFIEISPPLLVNTATMFGAGQLPKFKDQLFSLNDPDFPLHLIPTAEVPLNGIHQGEILTKTPYLYTAYTPCFRREAGALGRQERGLIRMHQFNKVELFAVCHPEESDAIFQKMLDSAEEVLQGLGLHYQNMLLVSGDLSFSARKTIDIEVYLPAQNAYYEASSVSSCGDFQARRAKIRIRGKEGLTLAHTLNGSRLATSRLMVSLIETYQKEDGSIDIPEVLRPYLSSYSFT